MEYKIIQDHPNGLFYIKYVHYKIFGIKFWKWLKNDEGKGTRSFITKEHAYEGLIQLIPYLHGGLVIQKGKV